eukprot:4898334-Amphidinium_carterae.1
MAWQQNNVQQLANHLQTMMSAQGGKLSQRGQKPRKVQWPGNGRKAARARRRKFNLVEVAWLMWLQCLCVWRVQASHHLSKGGECRLAWQPVSGC